MALKVEYKTLTVTDQNNNYVTLSGAPVDGTVAMDVISGTAQAYNTDFGVADTTVKWTAGYNLYNNGSIDSTGLFAGDEIRIMYDKTV